MREKIVASNWKMNKTLYEGLNLVRDLQMAMNGKTINCNIIVCPPFIHLASLATLTFSGIVRLGAQNCSDKASGAYTGEVSAAMLASVGIHYVILGHSERRAYYGETNAMLKEKVKLALNHVLQPIFCIGEVLAEREAGIQKEVVEKQIRESLFDLSAKEFGNIVLAYEPVWAIGTGKTATSEQAQEMHAFIRATIADKYGSAVAEETSILYGGSCNAGNAKELFTNPDVDGGLIGGASLAVETLLPIIEAFS
ncbi:MAG: triose-phosphate isomerase [Dysgonamonadaceae bacterium]|jgi:triosephosphate isomerase|nr:triose-phosphate isomerase [Dysgonamonadaceae bacterium]